VFYFCSHGRVHRFSPDQLRDKALLALEDAVQECRYRQPRRSFAVRFALAYLWAHKGGSREPFEAFWRAYCAEKSPWSFSCADQSLMTIYVELGLERPHKVGMDMWQRWAQHEQDSGVN
jgi:hypothetical protein